MVWRETFDVTLQSIPVVQVTGYSGFYAILKLYFKLDGLIKIENLPNHYKGLSILISLREGLSSWMLGRESVEQGKNFLTSSSSVLEKDLLTVYFY